MAESTVVDSEPKNTVRDSDLLRVLIALAGRIACPPDRLLRIVGPYVGAYNLCDGELTLAAIARSTGTDNSNLRKAMLKWEEAGALFRVGPQGRLLRLYSLPTQNDRGRSKRRDEANAFSSTESIEGESYGQEGH